MKIGFIEDQIGNTPLVQLRRLYTGANTVLCKLEGNNPGGSVKDRAAISLITRAEQRGAIEPGVRLIEATSGNTGIGLAMAAAIKGYHLTLIIPEHLGVERRQVMAAYGAEVRIVSKAEGMEGAIELARELETAGEGVVLNQYTNPDNPRAHYETTGPEIWSDTEGRITHFVSALGTTGTAMGTSRYLKERNRSIQIIGIRPDEAGGIPGIRNWSPGAEPTIYDPARVDSQRSVSRAQAVETMQRLAREEGIFAGISSGANVRVAVELATELERVGTTDAVIVCIICDRGDRYLSAGVFDQPQR